MDVLYITIDQVIEFHHEGLEQFGGLDGIRSRHDLAAAVMQPQQSAFAEDAYATIPEKAAAYGFFIAEAQAFLEGNKRAAAVTMLTFLFINGYELRQTDDEIAQMFEDVGSRVIGQGEFFGWVCNHSRPLSNILKMPSSGSSTA